MLFFDETQQVGGAPGAGAGAVSGGNGGGGGVAYDRTRGSMTRASVDSTRVRPGSRGSGGPGSPGMPPRPRTGQRRPGTSGSRRPGTSGGRRKGGASQFKRYLERGDLPATIASRGGGGNKLVWSEDPTTLDLHVFLPVFLDGIREKDENMQFMAVEGTFELLEQAGSQLADMLGMLVKPLKDALNTRRDKVVRIVLRVLQEIASSRDCAVAFIPHYRAILPTFNLLLAKRRAKTDKLSGIETVDGHSLGDLVQETLETLELSAGPTSSGSITQFVPGYRSCFEPRQGRGRSPKSSPKRGSRFGGAPPSPGGSSPTPRRRGGGGGSGGIRGF